MGVRTPLQSIHRRIDHPDHRRLGGSRSRPPGCDQPDHDLAAETIRHGATGRYRHTTRQTFGAGANIAERNPKLPLKYGIAGVRAAVATLLGMIASACLGVYFIAMVARPAAG